MCALSEQKSLRNQSRGHFQLWTIWVEASFFLLVSSGWLWLVCAASLRAQSFYPCNFFMRLSSFFSTSETLEGAPETTKRSHPALWNLTLSQSGFGYITEQEKKQQSAWIITIYFIFPLTSLFSNQIISLNVSAAASLTPPTHTAFANNNIYTNLHLVCERPESNHKAHTNTHLLTCLQAATVEKFTSILLTNAYQIYS